MRLVRAMMSGSYQKNPEGSDLSHDQKRMMSVGAIFCEQQSCYIDSLKTGKNGNDTDYVLEQWDIFNKEDARQRRLNH